MVALAALLTLAEVTLVAVFALGAACFVALIAWDVTDRGPLERETVRHPVYEPGHAPA